MDDVDRIALGLNPSPGNTTHLFWSNTTDLAHESVHKQVLFQETWKLYRSGLQSHRNKSSVIEWSVWLKGLVHPIVPA